MVRAYFLSCPQRMIQTEKGRMLGIDTLHKRNIHTESTYISVRNVIGTGLGLVVCIPSQSSPYFANKDMKAKDHIANK